jgi:hypothetical protein
MAIVVGTVAVVIALMMASGPERRGISMSAAGEEVGAGTGAAAPEAT